MQSNLLASRCYKLFIWWPDSSLWLKYLNSCSCTSVLYLKCVRRSQIILIVNHGRQEEVAKELGVPVQFQRFWIWAKRQNHTYRPNRPLTAQEETQTVCFFYLLMYFIRWNTPLLSIVTLHNYRLVSRKLQMKIYNASGHVKCLCYMLSAGFL